MKITMTPEEEFNQEVLWILHEIKKELLATPKGKRVEFSIRYYSGAPSAERQRKLLYKLQEWKALEKIESGDLFADNFLSPPKKYLLLINQQKFDRFCKKWENIDENPWLTERTKIIQRNKLIGKQKGKDIRIDLKVPAEETRKQFEELFEELDKKQKALGKLEEQISSQICKDLSVPIQYFKSYEEITKKISEQLAPFKSALEEISRLQSTTKNYLTPALQRLTAPIKQIEEQIRNLNELYKVSDHSLSEAIISPDLMLVQQGAEMISELREVRKLIEKYTIKKDETISVKWFNYKNNSISFHEEIYKPRSEPQARLIRQLVMKCQKENNNGTVLKEGQRVSENNLSNEINLTIEQLRHIKKQLKRSFKDKSFPLKIDSNAEGILLIYTI